MLSFASKSRRLFGTLALGSFLSYLHLRKSNGSFRKGLKGDANGNNALQFFFGRAPFDPFIGALARWVHYSRHIY
jgi:hypothetical protein